MVKTAMAGASRASVSEKSSSTSQTPLTIAPIILTLEKMPIANYKKKFWTEKLIFPMVKQCSFVDQDYSMIRYLNGAISEPAETNLIYPTCDTDNLIVAPWLVNSNDD